MTREHFPLNVGGYNPGGGLQRPGRSDEPPLRCSCGCTDLEKVEVGNYAGNHPVLLGMPLPTINREPPFYFYICSHCLNPVEQPLQFLGVDPVRQKHNEILERFRRRARIWQKMAALAEEPDGKDE